jgi:hypothetical protein
MRYYFIPYTLVKIKMRVISIAGGDEGKTVFYIVGRNVNFYNPL